MSTEVLPRKFREGLPMELLYADDLVVLMILPLIYLINFFNNFFIILFFFKFNLIFN